MPGQSIPKDFKQPRSRFGEWAVAHTKSGRRRVQRSRRRLAENALDQPDQTTGKSQADQAGEQDLDGFWHLLSACRWLSGAAGRIANGLREDDASMAAQSQGCAQGIAINQAAYHRRQTG